MERFDYVIVGAGSAGCVLAERLSADGKTRVLVLESGPRDRSPWIHLPVGYGKLFYHPRLNYGFHAEAQTALGGRRDYWPRGHVVGGSGAINAMVYCRGLPQDFQDWAAAGATGWNWEAVRKTYERIETQVAPDGTTEGDGPIHVSDVRDQIHPVNAHYFEAQLAGNSILPGRRSAPCASPALLLSVVCRRSPALQPPIIWRPTLRRDGCRRYP